MGAKDAVDSADVQNDEEDMGGSMASECRREAREHMKELEKLKIKDPDFYQYMKDNNDELLKFNDEEFNEEGNDMDPKVSIDDDMDNLDNVEQLSKAVDKDVKQKKNTVTSAMVDTWIKSIQENQKIGAVRSVMKAFRAACHCGDGGGDGSPEDSRIMSSRVFNKIMQFVLTEMDGIFREMLKLPAFGGKKETVKDLMATRKWKKYNHLVKSYLGNALHVLNQMTDEEMISFTLRRLRHSSMFLAAFPSLLRNYIKVILHFWGTGGGSLPVVSLLFLRDLCIRIGNDCTDVCFKGIYKAYVLNCHFINATKLQQINFLGNCVIELFRVDLPTAYQHAFVFIRQLAMILREALTLQTEEAILKVYRWKFINCLELWTSMICAYGSEADIRPLAYPLTQIITGVARLNPSAKFFPLRLRCIRMLNRIAASTGTFIPISMLLLEMLDMKVLHKPPSGGVGKAVDLHILLKVSKTILVTRAFHEACVSSVIEELAEHLAQWSYSIAFFELSFIPAVQLRSFCKSTKVERFRWQMREFIRQIEANSKFTNERRMSISFLPNDPAVTSFLEDKKKTGESPLSKYAADLHQKAKQRGESLVESSVVVGEHSSAFGNKILESDGDTSTGEGVAVFNSSWLPRGDSNAKQPKEEKMGNTQKKKSKTHRKEQEDAAIYEDIVEDLVLSSDEDDSASDSPLVVEDAKAQAGKKRKKPKSSKTSARKDVQIAAKKPGSAKRKRVN